MPMTSATCPYGKPGDRLWVRETWARVPMTAYRCSDGVQQTICPADPDMAAVYSAGWDRSPPGRWRPSIHMPRWASRITLEITAIICERLHDLTRGDAMAEGCPYTNMQNGPDPRQWYRELWDQINGTGSWEANTLGVGYRVQAGGVMTDLPQYLGAIFGVIGSLLVAMPSSKRRFQGFTCWLISNTCLLIYFIDTSAWGLVGMTLVYTATTLLGLWNNRSAMVTP